MTWPARLPVADVRSKWITAYQRGLIFLRKVDLDNNNNNKPGEWIGGGGWGVESQVIFFFICTPQTFAEFGIGYAWFWQTLETKLSDGICNT